MILKFKKYHGCFNTFICMDLRESTVDIAPHVPGLCLKKTWPPNLTAAQQFIGADGLIGVKKSPIADVKMVIINADGSQPEMCGNGLRCLAAFLHHEGITHQPTLTVETGAGILTVTVTNVTPISATVSVEMGQASFGNQLPTGNFLPDCQSMNAIPIAGYDVIPISMGNPHAVVFTQDIDSIDINKLGPLIQNAQSASGQPWFPNGVNVEFVEINHKMNSHDNLMKMRVYERGVGETMACGTGACAAVVAGNLSHRCHHHERVWLKGGLLKIRVNPKTFAVTMEGPAQVIPNIQIEL